MGGHGDPQLGEDLQRNSPGDAQRRGEPPGEVAAAGHVLVAAKLHFSGVVGVAGTGTVAEIVVVLRAGVGVADDGREGCAAGAATHQSREKFHLVGLLAAGGRQAPARGAALEKRLELRLIHFDSGGQSLHGHPDGRGVGLAEDGQAKAFAVGTAHKLPPNA